MNPQSDHITAEVRQMQLHLKRYPEQAKELAVAHFQDFLVLRSEYSKLVERLDQLKQPHANPELLWFFPFVEARLTLEQEFKTDQLRRHLLASPQKAQSLASVYFRKHLVLAERYQQKETEFSQLRAALPITINGQ